MELTIFFWSEPIRIRGLDYTLTVATSWEGLCWCGLGIMEKEETELAHWVGRYFPNARLSRSREHNEEVLNQVKEYLEGERRSFNLRLHPAGTSFQKRVWSELTRIPYGTTATYQEIAVKAGSPKGSRAVGLANSKNPIAIVVPCHRVIGKDGSLTGYAGGLDLKRLLLEVEGAAAIADELKQR